VLDIAVFAILAMVNFVLQDWATVAAIGLALWHLFRYVTITLWHWSATWSWDFLFGVGWLGMIQINEYAIGLGCLALFSFGLFSRLMHWALLGNGPALKSILSILIVAFFSFMCLITLANKGDKAWSGIPDYLASRVPLESIQLPAFVAPRSSVPLVKTAPTILAVLQREIEALKLTAARAAKPVLSSLPSGPQIDAEKARYEVSFWPTSISGWPIHEKPLPLVNGIVTFSFTFMAKDHMAKQTSGLSQ